MSEIIQEPIQLAGLSLKTKTVNANGQSSIDCKNLWHTFEDGNHAVSISNKVSDDIYGAYFDYEGDSSHPFSYFVGCRIKNDSPIPEGLTRLTIPAGSYEKISARGKMPDCVIKAWKDIWEAGFPRTYQIDFEVYDERSHDWGNAEVDVYVSVK